MAGLRPVISSDLKTLITEKRRLEKNIRGKIERDGYKVSDREIGAKKLTPEEISNLQSGRTALEKHDRHLLKQLTIVIRLESDKENLRNYSVMRRQIETAVEKEGRTFESDAERDSFFHRLTVHNLRKRGKLKPCAKSE